VSYHATTADEYWSSFIESMVDMLCDRLDSISGNLDRIATQLEEDSVERGGELASTRYPEEEDSDG
jgi:hypothetical protein